MVVAPVMEGKLYFHGLDDLRLNNFLSCPPLTDFYEYYRSYRLKLNGKWGIVDIDDCCSGAHWCVSRGLANRDWLCIDGGSAGGYTTLCALTFRDVFSAGASKYGVSDLTALYIDTHKFESRYLDNLIGKYPESKAIFDARCPIKFTDKLNCPIILLQGNEDKIVPPNQAEMMFNALKSKGIPASLVIYKGEQHGFRKSANIEHSLISEYYFFCQAFGIDPQTQEGFSGVVIGGRVEV